MAKILDGQLVAGKLHQQLAERLQRIDQQLVLGILQVGQLPASTAYINRKIKLAEKLHIGVKWCKLPPTTTSDELVAQIKAWNTSSEITGYIIQLPLPEQVDPIEIMAQINPLKDVDGLGALNTGLLMQGQPKVAPATTRGIFSLLKHYQIDPSGQHVVIVGRSNLVGKPTAIQFLNHHATVTIAHSHTPNLSSITRQADILVSAAGQPGLITSELVDPSTVVIDVGISRTDDGLVGDADFDSVSQKSAAITPVPGGIGPLTVVSLFQNLLDLFHLQADQD